jgi:hypothetical protein
LGIDMQNRAESLRRARDAETAHLEAALRIDGAKVLRLLALRDTLLAVQPDAEIELKSGLGEEPHLWLDLHHRITMAPDNSTFRLQHIGVNDISILLETVDARSMADEAQRLIAHRIVLADRASNPVAGQPFNDGAWRLATLVYVWMTGVITGFAALALVAIYMKKIVF